MSSNKYFSMAWFVWHTVYSFEFAQSYFRSMENSDWFAQSWICPLLNLPILQLSYIILFFQLAQFKIRPQVKRWKENSGEILPVYTMHMHNQ